MKRIAGQVTDSEELAKQVLSWIICSKRPLFISELQHALAVEIGTTELNRENIPHVQDIVSVCAGLVTVDEESGIIRLIHYTAQEYFERIQKDLFPEAESDITKTCVTYISFDKFERGYCPTNKQFRERLQSNELYYYASRYWGHHARAASTFIPEVIHFLQKKTQVAASVQALLSTDYHSTHGRRFPLESIGLHLAVYLDNKEYINILIKIGSEINMKDNLGQTPLWSASENGNETVVKLLLDTNKAEIESKDTKSRTPLCWASRNGHEAVVKLLLNTGRVEVDLKDKYDRTPLSLAAEGGHKAIVKLLLDTGKVDINLKNNVSWTPLSLATRNGHEAIFKLLLDSSKVDINSKDRQGRTPLSLATTNGHMAVVELL
jgi:ankyrin repeat protein